MKQTITLLAALLCSAAVLAHDVESDGIYYNLDKNTTTATVTYLGASYTTDRDRYIGEVIVPETIECESVTYKVTSIGVQAFCGCSKTTSVVLGENIEEIKSSAFWGCTALTQVTLPENLTSIGIAAFEQSGLTSFTIPKNANEISDYVLSGCKSLTTLSVDPENENFVVDDGILYSADRTRLIATIASLTGEVVIPEGVTEIARGAFVGLSEITSVTLPASLTTIGADQFLQCPKLTTISIAEVNTSFVAEGPVLYNQSKTKVILCANGAEGNIELAATVTEIGQSAFRECQKITGVGIPEGLTTLGKMAFLNCRELTSISLPESLKVIDERTFEHCLKLTTIAMPGVTEIGDGAFYNNQGLEELTLPASLTTLRQRAFAYCENLTHVEMPESIENLDPEVFSGCNQPISIDFGGTGSSVQYIDGVVYSDDGQSILYCFDNTITSVVVGEDVEIIEDEAFANCSSLATITFNAKLREIGESAFSGCSSLTEIELPATLETIGNQAFANSQNISKIVCNRTTPSVCGIDCFSGLDKANVTVCVPEGAAAAYKAAAEWSEFVKIVEPTVTAIDGSSLAQQVSVQGSQIFGPAQMQVFNLAGRDVTAQNVNLPAGVYVVKAGDQSTKVLVK